MHRDGVVDRPGDADRSRRLGWRTDTATLLLRSTDDPARVALKIGRGILCRSAGT